MRFRGLALFVSISLLLVGSLTAAQGRSYAAAIAPSSTATTSPAKSGPLPATAAPDWVARELDPVPIPGGWSSVAVVWVQGQVGLPVTIRSADGSWSTSNIVGTKPEYGPDALEFAPLWPGDYVIIPEGLGTSYSLALAPGTIAQVRFEPATPSPGAPSATTPASPTPPSPEATVSPAPAPAATPTPSPTLPSPTPPSTLAPAPVLIEPPDDTAVSLSIRLDLAWTWEGTLGPDDYFQVEIWNSYNDFSTPIDVAWVKSSTYGGDAGFNPAFRPEYRWRISVVQGTPPRQKDWSSPENQVWDPTDEFTPISEPSEIWKLVIDPGCPPGERSC